MEVAVSIDMVSNTSHRFKSVVMSLLRPAYPDGTLAEIKFRKAHTSEGNVKAIQSSKYVVPSRFMLRSLGWLGGSHQLPFFTSVTGLVW